jgi:plastocyanin
MKKLIVFISFILATFSLQATVHTIQVWDGYFQFLPNAMTIQLGDTIQWLPLDQPTMVHTITSDSIPAGAEPFDQIWQSPADTFFQYVPQVAGLYKYVCTPHVSLGMVAQFLVTDTPSAVENDEERPEPALVYPNPARHMIQFKNIADAVDYKIVDINGKIIHQGTTSKISVDITRLTPGFYFVDLLGDRREIVRFIKQ